MSAPFRDLVPTRRSLPTEALVGQAQLGREENKPNILPTSPIFAIIGILLGAIEQFVFNLPLFAHGLWTIALIGAGFPVVWRSLLAARRGNYATDFVASLSIVTAAVIE